MEITRCVLEKNVKKVYCNLNRNYIDNEPINGAIINIVSKEMFEPICLTTDNIDDCYRLQTCDLSNTQLQIDTPIICTHHSRDKVYCRIDESSYFLNSFYNDKYLFPEEAVFKENKSLSSIFKYYYLEKKDYVFQAINDKRPKLYIPEMTNNLNAISDFYSVLLKNHSTTEGIYILINIMMLLFYPTTNHTAIRSESLEEMKKYIFNQLQHLDEDASYQIELVSINYLDDEGNKVYNLLEWSILNGFCKAFNSVPEKSKKYLRNIFNEKSKL